MRPQPLISVTDVPRSLAEAMGYLLVVASPDGESPWPDPRVA